MRSNKGEKRIQAPVIFTGIFIAAIVLYELFAYPFYTQLQKWTVRQVYDLICRMDLAEITEGDEQSLQSFQAGGVQITITDEEFRTVYASSQQDLESRIDRYIISNAEKYRETPDIAVRGGQVMRAVRLRALLIQSGKTYYVSVRKEFRGLRELIRYTGYYLCAAALVMAAAGILLQQSRQKEKMAQAAAGGELDMAQKEFVANISHEMKTPLAVISGQVEMLQKMGDEIDQDYYFASIREEIDKMSGMVSRLLDLMTLEHRIEEMQTDRENLSDLMNYMLLKYDALFKKNGIRLKADIAPDCFVRGNRMYLEQAVNNYIMNAFQHTAQGKNIRISLEKEKEAACIRIYNDGARIPEDEMEQIWQSFYVRAHGKGEQSQKIRNAGIGLYTVKKITEQHGGSCGVWNQENGVEFWIRLKLLGKA